MRAIEGLVLHEQPTWTPQGPSSALFISSHHVLGMTKPEALDELLVWVRSPLSHGRGLGGLQQRETGFPTSSLALHSLSLSSDDFIATLWSGTWSFVG